MKRFLCSALAILMILSACPITIYASAVDEDEFNSAVSELLCDYAGDYYSEIKINVSDNTIQVDGESAVSLQKYDIDYSKLNSDEVMIPAVAVLDASGRDAELNKETGEIVVDDESYNFRESNMDAVAVSSEIENGIEKIYTDDNKLIENPVAFINEEQACESFNLETEYDDDVITVTNPYQTKRLIVQTKNNVVIGNTYNAIKVIHNRGYYILQFATEEQTKLAHKSLEKQKNIEYVCCDKVNKAFGLSDRSGAEKMNSSGYKKYLSDNGKSKAVTVAVIDTGCETSHEFLKGRLVKGYDVYKNSTAVTDAHGHGTHVSGIVKDNSPSCVKIMPIKVLGDDGSGTDLAIKQGIDYAVKHKAKVINMSLGGHCDGECLIDKAVTNAIKAGVTVVAAAGNDSKDCSSTCPAKIADCITVSSFDSYGKISAFSNFGKAVDLCAPGTNIESSYIGNSYGVLSGTSMAAPFVSAAAAMEQVNNSSLKPSGVLSRLKKTCADMFFKGWDKYSGAGLLNYTVFLKGNVNPATHITGRDEIVEMNYFKNCTWYKAEFGLYGNSDSENDACTDYTITSTSTNEKVAVFEGAYFIPKGAGKTTVTVSLPNGSSAKTKVVVNKIQVWTDYASSSYGGGKGTKDSPYLIYTPEQLARVAKNERVGKVANGKYFKLMRDIDLSGKYWISIANVYYDDDFISGSIVTDYTKINFDGNNHKILNMTTFSDPLVYSWADCKPVNAPWYDGNGSLFGVLSGANIKRLGIENAFCINGDGILASSAYQNTAIDRCYTSGYTKGSGLIGEAANYNIVIKNCYSSAYVGKAGLVNYIYSSNYSDKVIISNCFFCGEQLGNDSMDSYGGLFNIIESTSKNRYSRIYNCFNAKRVLSNVGIATQNNNSIISKSYYNKENKCGVQSKQGKTSNGYSSKPASFFKTKSSFTTSSNWSTYSSWDFKNTWAIKSSVNNGYPYLKNNKPGKQKLAQTGTWLDYSADSFEKGSGSYTSPYVITNAKQLARMAYLFRYGGGYGKYFVLENDIDLSAHEWFPIGGGEYLSTTERNPNNKYYFQGHFNGKGHTVKGLNISTTGDYIGFIAKANCAEIMNIKFTDVDIKAGSYAGGVCGLASYNNTISGCSVSGSISAKDNAGSITAAADGGTNINGCSSDANISCSGVSGGICAAVKGIIRDCSFTGSGTDAMVASGTFEMNNCYCEGCDLFVNDYSAFINNSLRIIDGTATLYKKKTRSVSDITQGRAEDCTSPVLNKKYSVTKELTANWDRYASKSFPSGKGTKASPYIIKTAEDMALAHKTWFVKKGVYFKLNNDIDMSGRLWNSMPYDGMLYNIKLFFEGNGHTIKNINLVNSTGFFDFTLTGGIISNVKLSNVKGSACSGLVGMITSGTVKNCSVSGNLIAPVDSKNSQGCIGGISSENYGTIERCSFSGTVQGSYNCGMITGFNSGKIRNCYSKGKAVNGVGIVDNNSFGEVSNCYTSAELIIGNYNAICCGILPTKSYSCDNDTGLDSGNSTSEEMKTKAHYKGWDFNTVWAIGSGYPYLRSVKSHKISYVTNGGTLAKGTPKTYKSSVGIVVNAPSRKSYAFAGWYTNKALTKKLPKDFGIKDYGDITLYAKWTPAYYVSFNSNGATSGSMSKQTVERDKSVALSKNCFKRKGYTFKGWAKSKKGKVVYKDKAKIKNAVKKGGTLKLYAIWKKN